MIRKIFLIALLAMFVVAGVAFAEGPTRLGPWQEVKTYPIVNVNTNETWLTTTVSSTYIDYRYHRILGFSMTMADTSKSWVPVVGLYDKASAPVGSTAATAVTTDYLFDEAEITGTDRRPRWYPYPKALLRGLTVRQGENTIVIIYYEDMRGQ